MGAWSYGPKAKLGSLMRLEIVSPLLSGHQPCLRPLRPRFNSGLEVVCGLSFSRSQSDSEGFSPGTPVFLPPQNRLPAYSIRLWCCAPRSYMGRVQGASA